MLPNVSSVTVDPTVTSECYTANNKHYCYTSYGLLVTWNEAKQFCAEHGYQLPVIQDAREHKDFEQFLVDSRIDLHDYSIVWIGARTAPVSNNTPWHWINGAPSSQ